MKRTILAGLLLAAFGTVNAAGLSWVELTTTTTTELFGNPSGATGFVLTETPDFGGKTATGATVSLGYLTQTYAGRVEYTFLGQESGFLDKFKLTIAPNTQITDAAAIGTLVVSNGQGAGKLNFRFEGDTGSFAYNGGTWCSTCSIGLIATNRVYAGKSYQYIIGYNDSAGGPTSLGDWDDMVIGVNAIPEPETYAMLLAGLGLMGFVARRRRKLAVS